MSSTAVKIGSDLADAARYEAKVSDRSLAGQIEHWTKIGKAIDPLLTSRSTAYLKRKDKEVMDQSMLEGKAELESVLSKFGIDISPEKAIEEIFSKGGPVYEADPSSSERVIEVSQSGERRSGTIENGAFIPS